MNRAAAVSHAIIYLNKKKKKRRRSFVNMNVLTVVSITPRHDLSIIMITWEDGTVAIQEEWDQTNKACYDYRTMSSSAVIVWLIH